MAGSREPRGEVIEWALPIYIRGAKPAVGGARHSPEYKICVNLQRAQLTSVVPLVNNYHARSSHSEQRTYRVREPRTGANFGRNLGDPSHAHHQILGAFIGPRQDHRRATRSRVTPSRFSLNLELQQ